MASVELKNVSKVFRAGKSEEVFAINNLNLQVADGELLVIVGPSGCGKSTTLRLIAGLEKPTGGTISFGGIAMNDVRPADRDVAMVFQNHALYPHMKVLENMAFGPKLRGVPEAEIETRVRNAATTLGLTALLDRYPAVLSGGQRQRVAMGRAIVRQPNVLLFDEPLSDLDAPMRVQMRAEIGRLHKRLATTIIYVTHDQAEAMTLGERIAVLKEGVLQQVAEPLTLFTQPANIFVAGFIGSPPMNLFRGRVLTNDGMFTFQENNPGGAASASRIEIPLSRERGERVSHFAEGNIVLGLRAEHIAVMDGSASSQAVHAVIERAECTGPDVYLNFYTGTHNFIARALPNMQYKAGDRVPLRFEMEKAVFFNPASGSPIL